MTHTIGLTFSSSSPKKASSWNMMSTSLKKMRGNKYSIQGWDEVKTLMQYEQSYKYESFNIIVQQIGPRWLTYWNSTKVTKVSLNLFYLLLTLLLARLVNVVLICERPECFAFSSVTEGMPVVVVCHFLAVTVVLPPPSSYRSCTSATVVPAVDLPPSSCRRFPAAVVVRWLPSSFRRRRTTGILCLQQCCWR